MYCPTCKNPIQDNSYECEWCGNQINVNDIKNNLDNALVDIIKSGHALEAVKYYMDNYKVTLKEAKNKIDTLISELNHDHLLYDLSVIFDRSLLIFPYCNISI